ncbi:TPA: ead/Ea22-like family protein [Klebsiella pneumoniae]|nr:ead/Ea22-like family protein [Klebsiella pneumoniae]
MTDITELAQSHELRNKVNHRLYGALEFQGTSGEHATVTLSIDECKSIIAAMDERLALVEALESEKRICATWRKTAKSTGEKLEKAQTINAAAEKLVRCKGRYHSEQNYRALAALFGVKTPDLPPLEHENVHYADAAEIEIAALRQRIAELESRTVKLPDLRQIVSGDRYVWSDGVYNYSQDVKVVLAAAGIKVEGE